MIYPIEYHSRCCLQFNKKDGRQSDLVHDKSVSELAAISTHDQR